jgi:hypothetical protein
LPPTINFDGWQTAVFRKIFGPLANFRKPEFVLGGSTAARAADQHDRAVTIVRDVDPANWEEASRRLAIQVIEERAAVEEAEHAAWFDELVRTHYPPEEKSGSDRRDGGRP